MKNFIAIESGTCKKGKYTFKVYKCTSQGLEYLAKGEIIYGISRGPESEVLTVLAENGYIPKKFSNPSLYYTGGKLANKNGTTDQKFSIRYIVP